MILTSKNLNSIFMDCLFSEGESTKNYILGEGIQIRAGFNPERLKKHESEICEMLNDLTPEFKSSEGGGSFLNMCIDKEGNIWTDKHKIIEQLVLLGTAIKKLSFLLPREMWSTLPGGVPYLVIS